jgi:hypothetical protein
MATTLSDDVQQVTPMADIISSKQASPGHSAITISQKITVGAAADDKTLYTVPAGKTLYVHSITCGNEAGTTQDMIIYNGRGDSPDTPVIFLFFPNWSTVMHNYNFPNPLVFRDGITVAAAETDVNEDFILVITGTLV